jgi:hypothetical protein
MTRPVKSYMFNGELLTLREISQQTGIAIKALQKRVQKGVPLELPRRDRNKPLYIQFRGQMLRAREIAPIIGVTASCIIQRYHRGETVDAPPHPGEEYVAQQGSRTRNFFASVLDHSRPYIFDLKARHVMNYLTRCNPISTDDEIRASVASWLAAEHGPGARVSDEGVAWIREQLRSEMFAHGGGHGETLEMLGDLDGVCRERIRQIEREAMKNFRASARRLGLVDEVVRELRERDATRRATWAERMDQESIGVLDLCKWNDRTTLTSLAKRSKRSGDINQTMAEYGRRGTLARMANKTKEKAA